MIEELAVCAEIEETVSQIYQILAEQLPEGNELRFIWEEMARDELDHARLLKFAQRFDSEETYAGFNLTTDDAKILLVEVKQTLDLVQMHAMNEREAIVAMLKLEEEFMQVHARYAIQCQEESLQDTFNSLGKADEVHVARLQEFSQRL